MPGCKAPERERREQILKAALRVAQERRLDGLTIRHVASRAHLSTGLVLFHFKSKDGLVQALLDWLLEENHLLQPNATVPQGAGYCLGELMRDECRRLATNRERTELFFDYWVAGTRLPTLRKRIRSAILRYRKDFSATATAALHREGTLTRGVSAEAVAAAAVSFIYGCAVQTLMDPRDFDLEAALAVVDAFAGPARDRTPPAMPHPTGRRSKRAK